MTKQLSYSVLPLTNDPYQVFTTGVAPDGTPLHARIEIRHLTAPDRWVVSIFDHAAATLLVNQIPLVASAGFPLDLLYPFRHLRGGKGIGSMFLLRGGDNAAGDPGKGNLAEYTLLYGSLLC
jgi:hypothetical protein